MKTLEVLAVLACDDVREELRNKLTFVGVLVPSFTLAKFPASVRLSFVIIANVIDEGSSDLSVRVMGDRDEPLGSAQGEVMTPKVGGALAIPVGPFNLPIDGPGPIRFEAMDEGKWRELQRWEVLSVDGSTGTTPRAKATRKRKPRAA